MSRREVVERSLWGVVNCEFLGGEDRGSRGGRPVQADDCGVCFGKVGGDSGADLGEGFGGRGGR